MWDSSEYDYHDVDGALSQPQYPYRVSAQKHIYSHLSAYKCSIS